MPAGSTYWIEEGMLDGKLYNARVKQKEKTDFICFSINNKFLHPNHPVGWIQGIDVTIDGEAIPQEKLWIVLRGQWISVPFMYTIRDIWWRSIEDAWIYVESDGLEVGSKHEVKCKLYPSLMVHAENVDLERKYPCLQNCILGKTMTVQEEVRK